MKINRSLRQPWPGTLLLAQEGCGADKISKLALLITGYDYKEFSLILRNFQEDKWHSELVNQMSHVCVEQKPLVLQFTERQLGEEAVLADLDAMMAHGEMLHLLNEEDLD